MIFMYSKQFLTFIEYPDSEPAVYDLSCTLQKTDFKSELCKKLQNALHSRLLHPAVNTIDIITAYTAAIKVLRKIDPCGALLQEVTQPIRYIIEHILIYIKHVLMLSF